MKNKNELRWYVVHTRSRAERVVKKGLDGKSIEVFAPEISVLSKRKDRKKMIDVPLFPGYIFVRSLLRPEEQLAIVKTPGAARIIGGPGGPVPVKDDKIDSLKIMVSAGQGIITGNNFYEGDPVFVTHGPFAGVQGVFNAYRGQGRVIVNIDLMGQSASVNVDEGEIKRI